MAFGHGHGRRDGECGARSPISGRRRGDRNSADGIACVRSWHAQDRNRHGEERKGKDPQHHERPDDDSFQEGRPWLVIVIR
jgi:hypothetical protein